jgi:hypothetical protein
MQGDPPQTMLEKLRLLPPDSLAEVEDFIDFLLGRVAAPARTALRPTPDFPVISVGLWPNDLGLHRENLYGGAGR